MSSLVIDAPAKLNLFLHVTGKRPDGYHLLESLVVFTTFGDKLEFAPSDHLQLSVTGPYAHSIDDNEDNLAMRAARALGDGKHGAHITLHKYIPVGAGLGGGSADAAAVLRGLTTLWGMNTSDETLLRLAVKLGSDVPVCLASQTAWLAGAGEFVSPVAFEGAGWIMLVNPGVKLLTADVFQRFHGAHAPSITTPRSFVSTASLANYAQGLYNMLETPAQALEPVIGEVLDAIAATPHCMLSRMSGSGATCFGLYNSEAEAQTAAAQITRAHPDWWCKVTGMYGKA